MVAANAPGHLLSPPRALKPPCLPRSIGILDGGWWSFLNFLVRATYSGKSKAFGTMAGPIREPLARSRTAIGPPLLRPIEVRSTHAFLF